MDFQLNKIALCTYLFLPPEERTATSNSLVPAGCLLTPSLCRSQLVSAVAPGARAWLPGDNRYCSGADSVLLAWGQLEMWRNIPPSPCSPVRLFYESRRSRGGLGPPLTSPPTPLRHRAVCLNASLPQAWDCPLLMKLP